LLKESQRIKSPDFLFLRQAVGNMEVLFILSPIDFAIFDLLKNGKRYYLLDLIRFLFSVFGKIKKKQSREPSHISKAFSQ
jgi:hypothetical protein